MISDVRENNHLAEGTQSVYPRNRLSLLGPLRMPIDHVIYDPQFHNIDPEFVQLNVLLLGGQAMAATGSR